VEPPLQAQVQPLPRPSEERPVEAPSSPRELAGGPPEASAPPMQPVPVERLPRPELPVPAEVPPSASLVRPEADPVEPDQEAAVVSDAVPAPSKAFQAEFKLGAEGEEASGSPEVLRLSLRYPAPRPGVAPAKLSEKRAPRVARQEKASPRTSPASPPPAPRTAKLSRPSAPDPGKPTVIVARLGPSAAEQGEGSSGTIPQESPGAEGEDDAPQTEPLRLSIKGPPAKPGALRAAEAGPSEPRR